MKVERMVMGPIGNNVYLLIDDGGTAAVIDPGFGTKEILARVKETGAKLQYILLTHGHFDHAGCAAAIREATGAKLAVHVDDATMLRDPGLFTRAFGALAAMAKPVEADILLHEGDVLPLGGTKIKVMHLPGHTPGSCFLIAGGTIFSGDVLFRGCVGRTDLTGGDTAAMKRSIARINEMKGDYTLCPGHDDLSTLAAEQATNPYLTSFDYDIYD